MSSGISFVTCSTPQNTKHIIHIKHSGCRPPEASCCRPHPRGRRATAKASLCTRRCALGWLHGSWPLPLKGYCGWTKSTSNHLRNLGNENSPNNGPPLFLGWCRILSIHSTSLLYKTWLARPAKSAPRLSMTLQTWAHLTPFFWVMIPFLKGHGESRINLLWVQWTIHFPKRSVAK